MLSDVTDRMLSAPDEISAPEPFAVVSLFSVAFSGAGAAPPDGEELPRGESFTVRNTDTASGMNRAASFDELLKIDSFRANNSRYLFAGSFLTRSTTQHKLLESYHISAPRATEASFLASSVAVMIAPKRDSCTNSHSAPEGINFSPASSVIQAKDKSVPPLPRSTALHSVVIVSVLLPLDCVSNTTRMDLASDSERAAAGAASSAALCHSICSRVF
mmetsp:Transcript_283/g.525  ORF Transcript_283/g.525 Transcript_283/m.525 type:complete len:217 (-) Transcript_283:596-1246(-)